MQYSENKHPEAYLAISFAALAALPLLYILRFLDDNRLTSWQWVMGDGGIGSMYLFVIPAILLAFGLARFDFPERLQSLFLFCAAFGITILLWDIPEVLLDASRYFVQAKYLALYGPRFFWQEWGNTIGAWTDMPLVPFLYGLLFKLFGETRISVQIFNGVLFSLAPVLTYKVAAMLWDEKTGFSAGFLLLAIPYLPTQVPLMLVDTATMFFLLFAIYAYLNALTKGGWLRCCISSIAIFLALFSKYSAWPMLGILPLITLVHLDKNRARVIVQRSLFIGLFSLLAAGMVFLSKRDVFLFQIELLRTFQAEGLKRWQEGYVSSLFFQVYPLVTVAALLGIIRAVRKKDYRFLVAGWFALFVFLLQVKRMRYMVPLLPLLTMMAAYGLQGLRDARLIRFACYACVFSSLVVLFGAYKPFLKKTSMNNLLEAGLFLNSRPETTFSVRCLPQHESMGSTYAAMPILDLYTRKNLVSETGWPSVRELRPDFLKASLRFSWELRQPEFYTPSVPNGTTPRVVIASLILPGSQAVFDTNRKFTLLQRFDQQSNVFRFKTLVSIFTPQNLQ
jgi:4-amino-4-deoxy-L-arabinose transferase-like glycosyltransferase